MKDTCVNEVDHDNGVVTNMTSGQAAAKIDVAVADAVDAGVHIDHLEAMIKVSSDLKKQDNPFAVNGTFSNPDGSFPEGGPFNHAHRKDSLNRIVRGDRQDEVFDENDPDFTGVVEGVGEYPNRDNTVDGRNVNGRYDASNRYNNRRRAHRHNTSAAVVESRRVASELNQAQRNAAERIAAILDSTPMDGAVTIGNYTKP